MAQTTSSFWGRKWHIGSREFPAQVRARLQKPDRGTEAAVARSFAGNTRLGRYTVDFCCVALKLIVEVDGEHHFTKEGKLDDNGRDQYLRELGHLVADSTGTTSCGIR